MGIWDFNDVEETSQFNKHPIWTLDVTDESDASQKQILKWLVTELTRLRQDHRSRLNEIQRHYKLYKGVSNDRLHRRNADRDDEYERVQVQRKVVINHLFDLTEQLVSRTSKYSPSVQFLPTNDEFHDKQASKLAKRLFDHVKYRERLDDKARRTTRFSKVAGEGYLFIEWDKDKGETHPQWEKSQKEGKKVPLMDENGRQMTSPEGKKLWIDKEVKVGDVSYKVIRPERLLFESRREWDDVDYFFKLDDQIVDKVRADYPKKASMIRANQGERTEETNDEYGEKQNHSDCTKVTFFFKPNKYLPKGRRITFTNDVILESIEYPYDHGEWPFERIGDIDVPGELHSRSFFINARQITAQINNVTTMAIRNIKLCSAPKWMTPKGAVDLASLNNNTGIVQYSGPMAPQLTVPSTIAPELFKIRDELKNDVQQVSGISGVSRGEPPPGIKAGVALQFLNEQENERQSSFIAKYNEFVRRVASKTIKVCSQYYKEDDERTIAIIGRNDEYSRVPFDMETLSRDFDVRIQNSSALPDSKAQKIQTIMDLSERWPTLVSEEQVVDMLDFGQADKWYDESTAATRAAERENENLMDEAIPEAEDYEYHMQHWKVHTTEVQKPGFKDLPSHVQQNFKDHILTHEMHMMDMAKKNPQYTQFIGTLPQFPLFFVPDHLAPKPDMEPILDPTFEPGAQEQNFTAGRLEEHEKGKMAEEQAQMESMVDMKSQDQEILNAGNRPPMNITQ